MSAKIPGRDYPAFAEAARTRAQWQECIAAALAAGGRRRVEGGETFVHGADGILVHEIYANVPAPKGCA